MDGNKVIDEIFRRASNAARVSPFFFDCSSFVSCKIRASFFFILPFFLSVGIYQITLEFVEEKLYSTTVSIKMAGRFYIRDDTVGKAIDRSNSNDDRSFLKRKHGKCRDRMK